MYIFLYKLSYGSLANLNFVQRTILRHESFYSGVLFILDRSMFTGIGPFLMVAVRCPDSNRDYSAERI